MTEASMERCLLDMPYEVLFGIFCNLRKGKLFEISKLCSKFEEVAGDKRLWKDVYIKYGSSSDLVNVTFAFEKLYSGPFPVKVIDLSCTNIEPPVSFEIGPRVEVKKLDLSGIRADTLTMKAILAKYQFTELHLDYNFIDCHGHIMGIAPEAFSNLTSLEVLSLKAITGRPYHEEMEREIPLNFLQWLAAVLSKYCQNLKTLDLSYNFLVDHYMLTLVKNLPTSLEKLCLVEGLLYQPENSLFKLFAECLPNLKELELSPAKVKYPSLLEFKYLEVLHVIPHATKDMRDLYMYLIRFPALKTVYIDMDRHWYAALEGEIHFETLRATLRPHDITVKRTEHPIKNNNFWLKTKTM